MYSERSDQPHPVSNSEKCQSTHGKVPKYQRENNCDDGADDDKDVDDYDDHDDHGDDDVDIYAR